jgi:hypothetical protein
MASESAVGSVRRPFRARRWSRWLAPAAIVAMLAFPSVASADPTAADKETARGLMAEGRAHRDKGDLQGALKSFAAADALMHVPTTGLELAKAQVAVGQLVEGRETALRVARSAEKPTDPAPFKAARQAASALTDDLEARIPSLTIHVKNVPAGATPTLTLDGADLPAAVIDQPRKLDPGHHVVEAQVNAARGQQEIDVAEKDAKEVTVELPDQAAGAPAAAAPSSEPQSDADQGPPPEGRSTGSKVLIFGGFGLAGAGVIAGTITGIMSISKTNSIKSSSACQSEGSEKACGPSENGDISSANTLATVSTVSFVVAGVGAVLGVVGLLTGRPSSPPADKPSDAPSPPADQTSLRVVPWIGLGSAGVSGTF